MCKTFGHAFQGLPSRAVNNIRILISASLQSQGIFLLYFCPNLILLGKLGRDVGDSE